jgi:hypothetical protein
MFMFVRSGRTLCAIMLAGAALFAALFTACADQSPAPAAGDRIALGTWGGDDGGMIVSDSSVHVHMGCTFGDIAGRVALDIDGRFDVEGSHVLRAFPVLIGPSLPARYAGRVEGASLRLTVTVTDTVAKQTVVLGPVTLALGDEPRLGPCPICRVPARRSF